MSKHHVGHDHVEIKKGYYQNPRDGRVYDRDGNFQYNGQLPSNSSNEGSSMEYEYPEDNRASGVKGSDGGSFGSVSIVFIVLFILALVCPGVHALELIFGGIALVTWLLGGKFHDVWMAKARRKYDEDDEYEGSGWDTIMGLAGWAVKIAGGLSIIFLFMEGTVKIPLLLIVAAGFCVIHIARKKVLEDINKKR